MTKFYRKKSFWLAGILLALLAGMWAEGAAQAPSPVPPQTTAEGQGAVASPEAKISPQEADELFRSVDQILKFASQDTDLPIKHEVKRRLVGRDEVEAYVTKHTTEGEDAKRLRRAELVLKKFGLLPRDFDLSKFLVALLKEQVAGYYDSKTKTVNLLDWVQPALQKPVLAHELTHALQDQFVGLERFMKPGERDLDREKQITPEDIVEDEAGTVRQAVTEGQAMAVLLDYMLAPAGKSLLDSPEVVAALKAGMMSGTPEDVEFHDAPIYLKESLTFPYRDGLDFIAALLAKGGKEEAFAETLRNPPHSTRQIMEPQTYLAGEVIPPMPLPDFNRDFKNYDRFDVGAVGEFDVSVIIDQYAGSEASRGLYPAWRGGYYYAARPKGNSAAPLALLYVSRWASAQKAASFAAIYAKSLTKRYEHVQAAGDDPVGDLEKLDSLTGKHTWKTEEGDVEIDVNGDEVLAAESLDDATVKKLEGEVFAALMVE
ncbi:MAG TPA: hypothetical protein VLV49_09315 [Terriglobales bacterium]|nr:hypothetical protein [Terriglobales bacterium]